MTGYSDQENDDAFPTIQHNGTILMAMDMETIQTGPTPDAFPNDISEWCDTDGDGYGDNGDAFRFDGSQWNDTDGDGYGDNQDGTNADAFPNDPTRWQDSDGDGYANEDDDFRNDATQVERYRW